MRRLTLHENDNCSFNIDQDFSMEESKGYWLKNHLDLEESICKLGQLEDIEEELGIDLITLHKALKDGIYWKGTTCVDTKGIFFENKPKINIRGKCLTNICFRKHLEVVYFKDYGKTWALTREELEENNE